MRSELSEDTSGVMHPPAMRTTKRLQNTAGAVLQEYARALASEWLHNGKCCKSAFSYPFTRRWTANRCPGLDRDLQRRADLRLCDQ